MEGGQQDKLRIGVIIQARMQSTRMPGKVLMSLPFPNGRPVLSRIVESLVKVEKIDKIIVATSIEKENDPIEEFCIKNGIAVYRGDELDVQSRFIHLIEEYGFDHVIRLTGDNPIIDCKYLEIAISSHLKSNSDYTKTTGLPLGTNFELIKSGVLSCRSKENRSQEEKEHVTYHFAKSDDFSRNIIQFSTDISDLRLTIDYPQDYAMLSIIFQSDIGAITLENIQRIITQFPWIKEINSKMIQKKF